MIHNKITIKIFCITGFLLLISSLVIYLTLYFLLPGYYSKYKYNTLEKGVNALVKELNEVSLEESDAILSAFVNKYNVRLFVADSRGFILYFSDSFTRIFNEGIQRDRVNINLRMPNTRRQVDSELRSPGIISMKRAIVFNNDNEGYELTVIGTLQPVNEASNVIIMFLPYMFIAFVVVAIIGALINSNLISKPLIQLNQTAKKMAKLDFSVRSRIETKDELGELSKNLNILADNLKLSMDELKEANLQLKDDIQKEREQEIKRREFIATISHELKTPLTAVKGQIEGMINNIGIFKDRDKYLRQSYQITIDMERLVHEILDISYLESNNFSAQITKIDLTKLVKRTLDNFWYFSELKDMEFVIQIEDELFINGDEKLITKAITNVLSNGIKYSGEKETLRVQLKSEGEEILLEVINTGVRIDEKHINKLFEPFYRIEKSRNRKKGGSGLGLYIVKKVLEVHNIEYAIENISDGVVFTMIFQKA